MTYLSHLATVGMPNCKTAAVFKKTGSNRFGLVKKKDLRYF